MVFPPNQTHRVSRTAEKALQTPCIVLKAEFLLISHNLLEQLGEALLLPLQAPGQDLCLLYSLDILNVQICLFIIPPV